METTKKHITQVVTKYIKDFPQEFADFLDGMKMVRETLADEDMAMSTSGESRALYEMPETLNNMLIMELSEEEMVWLKAGGESRKEGGLWFARTFPAFRIPAKV